MTHQRVAVWPIIAGFAILVSGCRGPDVKDLQLARIEVGGAGRESVPPELSAWRSPRRLVKLVLVTDTNVRNLARGLNLHLRADVYFCGDRNHELATMQMVFDSEGIVGENPAPSRSQGREEVWIFVADRAEKVTPVGSGKFSSPAYDLRDQPKDVCLQLHGRNMALEGFSSNVVIISSEKLTNAFAAASDRDLR